jgi:hypothetical protein
MQPLVLAHCRSLGRSRICALRAGNVSPSVHSTLSHSFLPYSQTRHYSEKRPLETISDEESGSGPTSPKEEEIKLAGMQATPLDGVPGGFYPPQQSGLRDAALTTIVGLGLGECHPFLPIHRDMECHKGRIFN